MGRLHARRFIRPIALFDTADEEGVALLVGQAFYAYAISCDGEIVYVGKGRDSRCLMHFKAHPTRELQYELDRAREVKLGIHCVTDCEPLAHAVERLLGSFLRPRANWTTWDHGSFAKQFRDEHTRLLLTQDVPGRRFGGDLLKRMLKRQMTYLDGEMMKPTLNMLLAYTDWLNLGDHLPPGVRLLNSLGDWR